MDEDDRRERSSVFGDLALDTVLEVGARVAFRAVAGALGMVLRFLDVLSP